MLDYLTPILIAAPEKTDDRFMIRIIFLTVGWIEGRERIVGTKAKVEIVTSE
jgi:hypothetical protein